MLKDDGQLAADGLRALVALIGTGSNLHLSRFDGSEDAMATQAFDFRTRWERAVRLMRERGIDALFLMKPANLAYITGDGRPCALGLFTSSLDCVVSVPTCDYADVRARSVATDIRQFKNEEDMFHGFRDVIRELGLAEATIGLEKSFFDAALFEVFKGHILPKAQVVTATPVLSRLRRRRTLRRVHVPR